MGVIRRVVKPKTKRAARALEAREPKSIENDKATLMIRGQRCSQKVMDCLKDLHALKRPNCNLFSKKNDIRPFEDATQLEFFCRKTDSSLFAFGSSNKKRPDGLILGRLFDHHILDMVEFSLFDFKSLSHFANEKIPVGTKPCLLFSGPAFELDDEMKRIKNLLMDFFRGPSVTHIRLAGIEHALQFIAAEREGKKFVIIRSYRILLKKSSSGKLPRAELEEIGPRVGLEVRRVHLASDDHFSSACKQVKNVFKKKSVKNISEDAFGSTLGRLHVQPQNIGSIQVRKMKGLKESEDEKKLKKLAALKQKQQKAEQSRQAIVQKVFES